jgi:hypothetical protein
VFVVESVEDHEPGYIRGVFHSEESAIADVKNASEYAGREWREHRDERGLCIATGDRFSGPCYLIMPFDVRPRDGLDL